MGIKLKPLTLASLLMLVVILFSLKLKFDLLDIQKGQKRVEVTIIDIPRSCEESSYRHRAYFRFLHNGEIHVKDIMLEYCDEIYNNKTIVLKTDDEFSGFLFEKEDVREDIAAGGALCLVFAIFIAISETKKKKVEITPRKGNYRKEKKPLQPKMGRYGNKI